MEIINMQKNKKDKGNRGFTLIEILVSIGIIAIISVLIAQSFFSTTRSNTKAELLKDIKQNGDYAIEIMGRMIRNARDVSSACPTAGSMADSLVLVNADGGTTTFGCYEDVTVTRIASTSASMGTIENLTGNTVSTGDTCLTSTLQFWCSRPAYSSPIVTIFFTLSQPGAPPDQFQKGETSYQTTVVMRN